MLDLQIRLLKRLESVVTINPDIFIDSLSKESVATAEENSASLFPKLKWSEIKKSGKLALCISFSGVKELIDKIPAEIFDGKLFSQHYATAHAPKARDRTQGYTSKAIRDLSDIQSSNNNLNAYELSLCEVSISFINDILVHE